MRRRGGLGRGLEALIPSTPQDEREPEAQVADQAQAVAAPAGESSGPTFDNPTRRTFPSRTRASSARRLVAIGTFGSRAWS